jgi:methylated-DNA-[protein]-cysteine S-methyltransferase
MAAGSEVLSTLALSAASAVSSSNFQKNVYRLCKQIPRGKVSTYGDIARALGRPKAYRAVGNALRNNPFAPHVPCHRVLSSDLRLNGFNGSRSCAELMRKRALLIAEGVVFKSKANETEHKNKLAVSSSPQKSSSRSASRNKCKLVSSPQRVSTVETSLGSDASKEVNDAVVDPVCVFTFA